MMYRLAFISYLMVITAGQESGRKCTRLNCPSNGGCLKQKVIQIQSQSDEKDRKIANLTARLEQLEKGDFNNRDEEIAKLTERVEEMEAALSSKPRDDDTNKDEQIANLTRRMGELEASVSLSRLLLKAQLTDLVDLTEDLLQQVQNRTSRTPSEMTPSEKDIGAALRYFFDRSYRAVITSLRDLLPIPIDTGDYICNTLCQIRGIREGNLELDWDNGLFREHQFECLRTGANVTFKWTGLQNVNELHIMDLLLCTNFQNTVGQQSGSETIFLNEERRYHFASGVGDNCIDDGIRISVCAVNKELPQPQLQPSP